MECKTLSILLLLFLLSVVTFKCIKLFFSEKVIKNVIDQISMGYFGYRLKDGEVLFANKEFVRILEIGEKGEDIVGRPIGKLFIPVDPDKFFGKEMKEKKRIDRSECRIRTLTGKDKIVTYKECIVTDPVTREEMAAVLIEDVTEKMVCYNDMRESREKYEKLFNSSGDMVMIFDIYDLSIKEANPAAEEFTEFSNMELLTMNIDQLVHPMYRLEFTEMVRDLVFSGKAGLETVLVRKSGLYLSVLLTITIMEIAERKMVIAVGKDISSYVDRKEEEDKRRRELEDFLNSSAEREERINDLCAALELAEEKIKSFEEKYGTRNGKKNE